MLYFQLPDAPENELEADVELTMRSILWGGSAEMFGPAPDPSKLPSLATARSSARPPTAIVVPDEPPPWLTRADLDRYVEQFTTSGFFGPISWYRNLDADWELTKDLPAPSMPCAFIGGDKDGVIAHRMEYVDQMETALPDYRGTEIVDDAGHWTQQEQPAAFNRALLHLLETSASTQRSGRSWPGPGRWAGSAGPR